MFKLAAWAVLIPVVVAALISERVADYLDQLRIDMEALNGDWEDWDRVSS